MCCITELSEHKLTLSIAYVMHIQYHKCFIIIDITKLVNLVKRLWKND